MPIEDATDPLLTIRELAQREGFQERHVRYLVHKKALPCYRIGALLRIRLSEYREWLEEQRV